MSKLTLDALKSRADGIASEELLAQISGGTANDCHREPTAPDPYSNPITAPLKRIADWITS